MRKPISEPETILQVLTRYQIDREWLRDNDRKSTWFPPSLVGMADGILRKNLSSSNSEWVRRSSWRDALASYKFAYLGGQQPGLIYRIDADGKAERCFSRLTDQESIAPEPTKSELDSTRYLAWSLPKATGQVGKKVLLSACRNKNKDELKGLFQAALAGLMLIHDQGYIHGDANWNNVFFDRDAKNNWQAQWIDFESSCEIEEPMPLRAMTKERDTIWGPDRVYAETKPVPKAKKGHDYLTLWKSFCKEMDRYIKQPALPVLSHEAFLMCISSLQFKPKPTAGSLVEALLLAQKEKRERSTNLALFQLRDSSGSARQNRPQTSRLVGTKENDTKQANTPERKRRREKNHSGGKRARLFFDLDEERDLDEDCSPLTLTLF